jgi:hypothetical protein
MVKILKSAADHIAFGIFIAMPIAVGMALTPFIVVGLGMSLARLLGMAFPLY